MKRHFPVEINIDYTDVQSKELQNIILGYLPVHILTAPYTNSNKTLIIFQFNLSFINALVLKHMAKCKTGTK